MNIKNKFKEIINYEMMSIKITNPETSEESRWLIINQKFYEPSFNSIMADSIESITPKMRIASQLVGSKKKKKKVYKIKSHGSEYTKQKIMLSYLKYYVTKNKKYNFLIRNTKRKSNKKIKPKFLLKPKKMKRLKKTFFYRLSIQLKKIFFVSRKLLADLEWYDNIIKNHYNQYKWHFFNQYTTNKNKIKKKFLI